MKLIAKKKEIKKRLVNLDLTYQDLADELKIHRTYLSRLLNGNITVNNAKRIVNFLGGSMTDYFQLETSNEEWQLIKQLVK
ncbi:helix-turn-helix transcriptional regulator [Staphylococcus hyicus]|uniref:helix-turn-helix transcriptional regulator n=1 Tax=Staphylococcus hyicus TaxID=1284 RepID=UPI00211CE802|nr:helix-turn-helix transcriptional regulator [Staphylococcus hyicus]MCQ9290656.1 helix-turn-helix transcriptional regulator [Staphylococcus hyicus]MCQ9305898.1 helix-turn-helix transcriptional regulator [Staphylococcus hyicus]MCQ9308310.1 helix-turn-helix transcriptional regulator [Staphylococcus hyicus]MCQ9310732.1 helix-turn-helix transcriptional regulator [Staphylococcus hyicus]